MRNSFDIFDHAMFLNLKVSDVYIISRANEKIEISLGYIKILYLYNIFFVHFFDTLDSSHISKIIPLNYSFF